MKTSFDGKVALVTGASSGIGRATAIAFGKEGARVVVAARRVREGEETAQMVRDAGGEAIFLKTDVSRALEVQSLVEQTVERFGRLNYAFNNAGISGPSLSLVADLTEEDWDSVIDANLKSIWLSMKYEIPVMLSQGAGAIINMSFDTRSGWHFARHSGLRGEQTCDHRPDESGCAGIRQTGSAHQRGVPWLHPDRVDRSRN